MTAPLVFQMILFSIEGGLGSRKAYRGRNQWGILCKTSRAFLGAISRHNYI